MKSCVSGRGAMWHICGIVLVWAIAVCVFFAPAVFDGKVIAPIDCIECIFRPYADQPLEKVHNQYVVDGASQYIPHKWALKKSWQEDGYMGWNPYCFNGTACPENTMYSPGDWHNWLFAFMPLWPAWNLGIILHFFIAGCGMLLLLRHYKIPMWVALLAAISFSFYSQFITCMYYRWFGGMVWAPYLVWALIKFRQYLVNVPAIIFMTLIWRGGHMQSYTFAVWLVACVWSAELWKKKNLWPSYKEMIRITVSYILVGVIAALLAVDVFVDTFPRMTGCRELCFSSGLGNLSTLVTSVFPNIMGIPETMDAAKMLSASLFDVKFGGSVVFLIAVLACFNRRAPLAAKVLFTATLVAVCTPLSTYFYSRASVVMALGMAWLAAWQLYDFTNVKQPALYWRRIGRFLGMMVGLWLLASVVIAIYNNSLLDFLNHVTEQKMSIVQQLGRKVWYGIRNERFLSQILIWDWRNLVLVSCLALGWFSCSRIKPGNSRNKLWILSIVGITYVELLVFSSAWVTYSSIPEGPFLYKSPLWMAELKKHVQDGSLAVHNTARDLDFLSANHLSSYGVRLADGYETVRPQYLKPLNGSAMLPEDYALAGISHIMADTKWTDCPVPGWNLVMAEKEFKLYANPVYKGRYLVNGQYPIRENWRTSNRISIRVPAESQTLLVLESFHKGWRAWAGERELAITPTERGGMNLKLPYSSEAYDILLQFRMPYQLECYTLMGITAALLLVVVFWQRKNGARIH